MKAKKQNKIKDINLTGKHLEKADYYHWRFLGEQSKLKKEKIEAETLRQKLMQHDASIKQLCANAHQNKIQATIDDYDFSKKEYDSLVCQLEKKLLNHHHFLVYLYILMYY